MSHLSILNKLKKGTLVNKHPLADQELEFRYAYGFGVAFMACADKALDDEEKRAIEALVRELGLPVEYIEKILRAAEVPQEEMIQGLIQALQEKNHKYLFLADLYRISIADAGVSAEEEEVVSSFAELLGVPRSECLSVKEIVLASDGKDIQLIADQISALIKKQLVEQAHLKFTDGINRGIYKHSAVLMIETDQRDGRKKVSLLEHNVKLAARWQADMEILKFDEVYYCEANQVSIKLLHADAEIVLGNAVVDISADEQILFVNFEPHYYAKFKMKWVNTTDFRFVSIEDYFHGYIEFSSFETNISAAVYESWDSNSGKKSIWFSKDCTLYKLGYHIHEIHYDGFASKFTTNTKFVIYGENKLPIAQGTFENRKYDSIVGTTFIELNMQGDA